MATLDIEAAKEVQTKLVDTERERQRERGQGECVERGEKEGVWREVRERAGSVYVCVYRGRWLFQVSQ